MKELKMELWVMKEYVPKSGTSLDDAARTMLELWSDYCARDVFEACWLIETQLREMKEAGWTKESARKELADILAITIREMAALGFDPAETLMWRLGNRHSGQVDEIVKKYEQMFINEFGPTRAALEKVLGESQ